MEKTKKERQEAAGVVRDIVVDLAASAALGTLFPGAHHFFSNVNNCPKCKVPISPVLMDDGVMPEKCPYCGASIDNE